MLLAEAVKTWEPDEQIEGLVGEIERAVGGPLTVNTVVPLLPPHELKTLQV